MIFKEFSSKYDITFLSTAQIIFYFILARKDQKYITRIKINS